MIAKYILIVVINTSGSSSSYSLHTVDFFSLDQCKKNALYLKNLAREGRRNEEPVLEAYCTEK